MIKSPIISAVFHLIYIYEVIHYLYVAVRVKQKLREEISNKKE